MISRKFGSYLRLMRLDKPIGILLLLWPTLWAVWIAGNGRPDLKIIIIFALGVIVMRSAGCVINDIVDRNLDLHVTRTRNRPLATKEITVTEAIVIFCILLFIALILVLQLNLFTLNLSIIGLLIACFYPLAKRFTHWPQVILGAAFAWGIPMAFAAQIQPLAIICWLLFAAGVLWPIAYDTQYAMVDRADDMLIGIKSTAIIFGRSDIMAIAFIQILMLLFLLLLGILQHFYLIYYIGLLLAGILFIYQYFLIRHREPAKCFKAFLNNHWVGLIIFISLLLNYTEKL